MWEYVVQRDARIIWDASGARVPFERWLRTVRVICVAPLLAPALSGTCSGPQTVEHVHTMKTQADPIARVRGPNALEAARRAASDAKHLVACCWAHNVDHPPSKELREAMRDHLSRVEP